MFRSGTKVVVEIPDALDPAAADQKYVEPLRLLLAENHAGLIVAVAQGAPKMPDEFTRIITLELTDFDGGFDLVGEFLTVNEAPPGTLICIHDADDNVVDRFILT